MPDYTITADTPTDVEALRTLLKGQLQNAWPAKPSAAIVTDPDALDALADQLRTVLASVDQLKQLLV